MSYIYKPTGRAKEYAPWALNIFSGCSHACSYCYARERWHKTGVQPVSRFRTGADWRRLTRGAEALKGDPRPIMLCFTCDPYPHASPAAWAVSDAVLALLLEAGLHVRILSKGGVLPQLSADSRGQVEFGQTITFTGPDDWRQQEPGTAHFGERLCALEEAKSVGLRTFASLEPVVDPEGLTAWLWEQKPSFIDRFNIGRPPSHCFWPDLCTSEQLAALVVAAKGTGAVVGLKRDAWDMLCRGGPPCTVVARGCEHLWKDANEPHP